MIQLREWFVQFIVYMCGMRNRTYVRAHKKRTRERGTHLRNEFICAMQDDDNQKWKLEFTSQANWKQNRVRRNVNHHLIFFFLLRFLKPEDVLMPRFFQSQDALNTPTHAHMCYRFRENVLIILRRGRRRRRPNRLGFLHPIERALFLFFFWYCTTQINVHIRLTAEACDTFLQALSRLVHHRQALQEKQDQKKRTGGREGELTDSTRLDLTTLGSIMHFQM